MLHMLARALADHSQDNVCLRRATQEAGLGLGGQTQDRPLPSSKLLPFPVHQERK